MIIPRSAPPASRCSLSPITSLLDENFIDHVSHLFLYPSPPIRRLSFIRPSFVARDSRTFYNPYSRMICILYVLTL